MKRDKFYVSGALVHNVDRDRAQRLFNSLDTKVARFIREEPDTTQEDVMGVMAMLVRKLLDHTGRGPEEWVDNYLNAVSSKPPGEGN